MPSDQLQWMIQGFSRCISNNICKGKSYFWRGFGKSPFYWLQTRLLRGVLYRPAVSRIHMSISSNLLLCLNSILIPLLEANSFSSLTVGFCFFLKIQFQWIQQLSIYPFLSLKTLNYAIKKLYGCWKKAQSGKSMSSSSF